MGISDVELREHVVEQYRFLARSARDFDDGDRAEAKRIATTLRVLLHQAGASHAVLWQVREPTLTKFASFGPGVGSAATVVIATGPLLTIGMTQAGIGYYAKTSAPDTFEPFADWWDATVYRSHDISLKRSDVVKVLANMGGGAHVDPRDTNLYRRIAVLRQLGWVQSMDNQSETSETPMNNPLPEMARSMATEVMTTLEALYP